MKRPAELDDIDRQPLTVEADPVMLTVDELVAECGCGCSCAECRILRDVNAREFRRPMGVNRGQARQPEHRYLDAQGRPAREREYSFFVVQCVFGFLVLLAVGAMLGAIVGHLS